MAGGQVTHTHRHRHRLKPLHNSHWWNHCFWCVCVCVYVCREPVLVPMIPKACTTLVCLLENRFSSFKLNASSLLSALLLLPLAQVRLEDWDWRWWSINDTIVAITILHVLVVSCAEDSSFGLPWYIMTSPATHAPTFAFFESKNYFGYRKEDVFFFEQATLPCLTADGKIMM